MPFGKRASFSAQLLRWVRLLSLIAVLSLMMAILASALATETLRTFWIPSVRLLVLLATGLLAYHMTRPARGRLLIPLLDAVQGAQGFSLGRLDDHTVPRGSPELQERGDSMSWMASDRRRSQQELAEINRTLEQRVAERIRDLTLVAEVFSQTAVILEVPQLLQAVCNLTKEKFGLYHTHIYLLDAAGKSLVLAAGAGEVGQEMVRHGHHILLDQPQSLVARAARTHEVVIADDVRDRPDFLPNSLLPDTRSELAVALVARDRLLGVLDVQGDMIAQFGPEARVIMETLGRQIAVALSNAYLFRDIERSVQHHQTLAAIRQQIQSAWNIEEVLQVAVRELGQALWAPHTEIELQLQPTGAPTEVINRRPIQEDWESYLGSIRAGERVGYQYNLQDVLPLNVADDSYPLSSDGSCITQPILLRGKPIGTIRVHENTEHTWTEDEIHLVEDVAEHIALAVEQYLAFDDTHIALSQTETLYQASQALIVTTDPQQMLSALVQIVLKRDPCEAVLFYNTADAAGKPEWMEVVATARTTDEIPALPVGVRYQATALPIMQAPPRRLNDVITISDVEQSDLLDETACQLIKERNIRACLFVPLSASDGRWLGTINFNWPQPRWFSQDEQRLFNVLAPQVATVIENRQLFEQVQKRVVELQTVAEVGAQTSTILDIDKVLWMIVDLTQERFGLYHVHIYLLDETGDNLVLAAGTGEPGQSMVAARHRIPSGHMHSLVARAARTRESVIVGDVMQEPDFLPNPLLPHTRSEVAVPLIIGDRVIGVLDVQSDEVDHFAPEDELVLTTLASQIAAAVQNAQFFAEQVKTAEQLRAVDRLKSEFLANMSHELRTPLNSIIGYAEILLDGIDGALTDEMQEDVTAIHESGKHLLDLINDILDLAKIESGQLDLIIASVPLRPIVNEALTTSRVLIKGKPVELQVDIPDDLPKIKVDPQRLRQIIINLISNAIKFTQEGSITVRARVYEADPAMLQIGIIDTGIGISPEHLPLIFERFRQVDQSATRQAGGTGLGLAITRQLVQMHGGDIWVESGVGLGSTFNFTVPLATG